MAVAKLPLFGGKMQRKIGVRVVDPTKGAAGANAHTVYVQYDATEATEQNLNEFFEPLKVSAVTLLKPKESDGKLKASVPALQSCIDAGGVRRRGRHLCSLQLLVNWSLQCF